MTKVPTSVRGRWQHASDSLQSPATLSLGSFGRLLAQSSSVENETPQTESSFWLWCVFGFLLFAVFCLGYFFRAFLVE